MINTVFENEHIRVEVFAGEGTVSHPVRITHKKSEEGFDVGGKELLIIAPHKRRGITSLDNAFPTGSSRRPLSSEYVPNAYTLSVGE